MQRHGAAVAELRSAWRQQSQALIARIPQLVRHGAPRLPEKFSKLLIQVLTRIIAGELAQTSARLDGIDDSLTSMLDAEAHLIAVHNALTAGLRPLLEFVRDTVKLFASLTPPAVKTDAGVTVVGHIPLIAFAREGKSALTRLVRLIFSAQALMPALTETVAQNLARATGQDPTDDKRALASPSSLEGAADNVATITFADTPFLALLLSPVPIRIPLETRFEHTHIIAAPGWGKSQFLQHEIARFLSEPSPPSLVIIDSQGDMLDKIQRLDLFAPGQGRLADKLILIDPRDIAHPPAINIFALQGRAARQGATAPTGLLAEQIANGTIELMETIYGAILGAEPTQMQSLLSRMITRLMFTIPDATILTLRDILEDPEPFTGAIAAMPGDAGHFLQKHLTSPQYRETREQILRRLWGILEQQSFARMLATPDLRIDLFDCLQTGRIVLVNTAIDFLQPERSAVMGRIFVALTLQATL